MFAPAGAKKVAQAVLTGLNVSLFSTLLQIVA